LVNIDNEKSTRFVPGSLDQKGGRRCNLLHNKKNSTVSDPGTGSAQLECNNKVLGSGTGTLLFTLYSLALTTWTMFSEMLIFSLPRANFTISLKQNP
jgi:hypothetical protein